MTVREAKQNKISYRKWSQLSLLFLIFSSLSAMATVESSTPAIIGYQTWKSMRVDQAKSQLERVESRQKTSSIKSTGKRGTLSSNPNPPIIQADQRVLQAQVNLDIASELTVNDYFLLYLRQFKEKEAFVEAAKKLSPEEVADLLMAYQKSLSGEHDMDVLVPAAAQIGRGSNSKN